MTLEIHRAVLNYDMQGGLIATNIRAVGGRGEIYTGIAPVCVCTAVTGVARMAR